jgi:hypothetical protein
VEYLTYYRTTQIDGLSIFYREASPTISLPTITLEGDANGAPHPESSAYRAKFTGAYEHRTITGGVGHNLSHAASQVFAQAVMDVRGF